MSIFVTNEAGDLGPFEYDVAPSTKIEDLKKRVSADVNMPVENIFFKAQKDDSKIDATSDLSGNNVVDKDTIYIYEPTMVVNVVDLDGNTHQYDVTPSTLVDDLKKNVSDDTGIPVDEVEIVDEDGAFLEDADLAYNLVNDKDTLYVHSFCSGNGKALDAFSDPSFEAIGAANGGVSGTSTPWYSINSGEPFTTLSGTHAPTTPDRRRRQLTRTAKRVLCPPWFGIRSRRACVRFQHRSGGLKDWI